MAFVFLSLTFPVSFFSVAFNVRFSVCFHDEEHIKTNRILCTVKDISLNENKHIKSCSLE